MISYHDGFVPAGTATEPSIRTTEEVIQHMKDTTEETFEFSIKIKDRSIFWILYLTDKLSDNWGFTITFLNWTLINFSRPTKWWRTTQGLS